MEQDEFYVGYDPQAPDKTSWIIKRVVMIIGLVVLGISLVLVLNQHKFSTATFEYGVPTTLEGYVFISPVPHLKKPLGMDVHGNSLYQTILLVGFGKKGAHDVLEAIVKNSGGIAEGKLAALNGSLIYGDGKTLLQITEEDNQNTTAQNPDNLPAALSTSSITIYPDQGKLTKISGEVVDPKCYFGVMKPGEGKPHRSCAIRCIAGGIPPVFKSEHKGEYFLLLDENSEPIHNEVLGIVGDCLELSGEITEFDDWKILKIKKEDLKRLTQSYILKQNLLVMEKGMTLCAGASTN